MIGKAEWFARRKYTGWGFTPKTWQGWVYVLVMIAPIAVIAQFGFGRGGTIFLVIWALVFAVDFIDIMMHLGKDERERIHEAIAERNALWAIVAVLGAGIAYQAARATLAHEVAMVDPVILIALGVGLVAKIASNLYLDRKN